MDYSNIASGNRFNFKRHSQSEIDHLGTAYDCNSVMHYNAYAFAMDPSRPTIYLNDPNSNCNLGQREMFSRTDIAKINMLYGCDHDSGGNEIDSTHAECADNSK